MPSYAEYFASVAYKPKWFIGDRVFGYFNKIPFVGSVGNDSVRDLNEGPIVSIILDLPIKIKDKIHNVILVKPKDIKRLIEITDNKNTYK